LALFLTGLGDTTQATVNVAAANCPTTYVGPAPGFIGLDQINCVVPAGIAANPGAPLTVTAGGRTSNTATVAIQ